MKEINTGIFETNNKDNIFIIGDIHGDCQCLIHCLVDLCKACYIKNNILYWNNKNTSTIIFTGDMIHRKRFDNVLDDECSDIFIIEMLLRLKNEAENKGGKIIIISGNHEMMNIISPHITMYISDKNIDENFKFFTNKNAINNYINNSYAWIKLNDILISHGGLCSEYVNFFKNKNINNIVEWTNNKYREYFNNYDFNNKKKDNEAFELFELYENDPNSKKHNMFWCREWGYNHIDCNNLSYTLKQVECNKMIIAHCPQFLYPEKPQMINFECNYTLAKIDLGMSRGFDYNDHDQFKKYFEYNFNRKMAVLHLHNNNNILTFDNKSIISKKISCMQYMLLKYGITKDEWKKHNIYSNWIGFDYINELSKKVDLNNICNINNIKDEILTIMIYFLYPVICKKPQLNSLLYQ